MNFKFSVVNYFGRIQFSSLVGQALQIRDKEGKASALPQFSERSDFKETSLLKCIKHTEEGLINAKGRLEVLGKCSHIRLYLNRSLKRSRAFFCQVVGYVLGRLGKGIQMERTAYTEEHSCETARPACIPGNGSNLVQYRQGNAHGLCISGVG